jgi:hypothetical protein
MPVSKFSIILIPYLILLATCDEVTLRTRLNTDQIYRSSNVKASELYAISVDRISSTAET